MDYYNLFIGLLFALGTVLWRLMHKQRIKDREERLGMKGALNWDLHLSSFMIMLFSIGASVVYIYKFITS